MNLITAEKISVFMRILVTFLCFLKLILTWNDLIVVLIGEDNTHEVNTSDKIAHKTIQAPSKFWLFIDAFCYNVRSEKLTQLKQQLGWSQLHLINL